MFHTTGVTTRVFVFGAMVLVLPEVVMADLVWDDGLPHHITETISDKVWVYNSFPADNPTQVYLYEQGRIDVLYVHGDGEVYIQEGSLAYLQPVDASIVEMSGGAVDETMWAGGHSTVTITGGHIGGNLLGNEESEIVFWGTSVSGNFGLSNSSRGTLWGGDIGGELIVNAQSQLTVYGADFVIDGNAVEYGTLTTGGRAYVEVRLAGILFDGSPLDNTLIMTQDASVVLIPEPCTVLLLLLSAMRLRQQVACENKSGRGYVMT